MGRHRAVSEDNQRAAGTAGHHRTDLAGTVLLGALASGALAAGSLSSPAPAAATCVSAGGV
jgi:hypothetical protein